VNRDEAAGLIRGVAIGREPETWADLGAGDGTFTLALAAVLPRESTIHAIDQDISALRRIGQAPAGISIVPHAGDFTVQPWPFTALDGVLLANSLHYVRDRAALIRDCERNMKPSARFLVVEYDTDKPNPWVPYPISFSTLKRTFGDAGYSTIRQLGTRPSIYQRAQIYAASIEKPRRTRN
jgi:ubiquinone/menaquinone biosynthesis C-methylase UbiE